MKKVVLLAIVLIFAFYGCNFANQVNDINETLLPDFSTNKPLPSNISNDLPDNGENVKQLTFIYPAYNDRKYQNLMNWQTYIAEKFGVELLANYKAISVNDLINASNDSIGILYLNYEKGRVYEFNTDVFRYGNDTIAYELTPYYEKYNWGDFIEQSYIDALSDNGNIYAIPAACSKYIIPRYYNQKHLSEIGVDIPQTTFEFYNYLRQLRAINPNTEAFYPMCISAHALSQSTADIFRAYGIFVNTEFNSTISFNPNSGSFEDGVYSDDFEASLGFMRQLQVEDLLIVHGYRKSQLGDGLEGNIFREDIKSLSKDFSTEYNYIYSSKYNYFLPHAMTDINYEAKEGFYLTGENSKNVCEIRSDISFYVFPKKLQNINGIMELFNEIFTGSAYYADLKYGIEGTDYFIEEDRIMVNEPLSEGMIDFKQLRTVNDNSANYVPTSLEVMKTIDSGLTFEQNVFNQLFTVATHEEKEIISFGDNMIQILFNSYISPKDSMDEYKELFNKTGKYSQLLKINERLGTACQYNYGN